MHSFTKITQNEFDPLKNMAAMDPYLSEPFMIQLTYGLNNNSIECLHPLNFLNIIVKPY